MTHNAVRLDDNFYVLVTWLWESLQTKALRPPVLEASGRKRFILLSKNNEAHMKRITQWKWMSTEEIFVRSKSRLQNCSVDDCQSRRPHQDHQGPSSKWRSFMYSATVPLWRWWLGACVLFKVSWHSVSCVCRTAWLLECLKLNRLQGLAEGRCARVTCQDLWFPITLKSCSL